MAASMMRSPLQSGTARSNLELSPVVWAAHPGCGRQQMGSRWLRQQVFDLPGRHDQTSGSGLAARQDGPMTLSVRAPVRGYRRRTNSKLWEIAYDEYDFGRCLGG
jgi:hypothetical protein